MCRECVNTGCPVCAAEPLCAKHWKAFLLSVPAEKASEYQNNGKTTRLTESLCEKHWAEVLKGVPAGDVEKVKSRIMNMAKSLTHSGYPPYTDVFLSNIVDIVSKGLVIPSLDVGGDAHIEEGKHDKVAG